MRRFQTDRGFLRRHALPGLLTCALAFCCVVALVLVDLAISRRSVSDLMSAAARAELVRPARAVSKLRLDMRSDSRTRTANAE